MNLVITGSSSGIGRHLAESLAKQGHQICRIARSPQQGLSLQCDVSDWNAVREGAERVAAKWGAVDGLVCCAGIQDPIGPAMEIEPAAWRSALAVNLDGTFYPIRAFFGLLRCAQRRAKVICFSGGGSTSPRPNFAAYGVAKTGVVRLVETLAAEWEQLPIDINAVAPGAIFTRMTEQVLASGEKSAGKKEFDSAGKLSRDNSEKLNKVLGLVQFLLSEKSDGITGKLISAQWDPWEHFSRDELMKSEIYTLRRITK